MVQIQNLWRLGIIYVWVDLNSLMECNSIQAFESYIIFWIRCICKLPLALNKIQNIVENWG